MHQTTKSKQLLIKGEINEDLLTSLQRTTYATVDAASTKSIYSEGLSLIFNDFSILAFTRDLLLSSLLTASYNEIKSTVALLLQEKAVKSLKFIHKFSYDDKVITVSAEASPSQVSDLIEAVDDEFKSIEKLDLSYSQEIVITSTNGKIQSSIL